MIPILTPTEMAAVDSAAPEPFEVLVHRAGFAVASAALRLLGGSYGRRVVVVAGPGNNGQDGRVAAQMLRRSGVRVTVLEQSPDLKSLPSCDLVIDAGYGTGFHGTHHCFSSDSPVLAVDICSGLNGLTGEISGSVAPAVETVSFAALKPGLLFGDGPEVSGRVHVADIGLDVSAASMHLVTDSDLRGWVPKRELRAHKWSHAVWLIAGSPGMSGAAELAATAALRGGAGYLRLSTPGGTSPTMPIEAVGYPLNAESWASEVVMQAERFQVVAVGPGLGRSEGTRVQVRELVAELNRPVVLDGDALWALGLQAGQLLKQRRSPTIITPHDGEFEQLMGHRPGADRIAAARELAAATGAVVLLKGQATVVTQTGSGCLVVRSGDSRLATAGTGDVLTGLIASHLALGADPLRAAASAAQLHGRASMLGPERGLLASDIAGLLAEAWNQCEAEQPR
ncbi:MAG: NAD(P)H-hydrate dehydratase [Actinobacteria bacterium]|uniref:Nicotinamide nucleotide repair protein n=1 Tax=freshwater metagenome TaxID=449393 RepID=A0A6J7A9L8_9ZZZZ|nr:NAD(P)H-hydrate dehydratase [Actinomycetota bacterium]